MYHPPLFSCLARFVLVFVMLSNLCALAEDQLVLDGKQPNDRRLQTLKDLNGHFPFLVPDSLDTWLQRAEQLRHRIRVATGIWPMPTRTPLNPVIHGRTHRKGFTVEKVYFESLPGHYVTGLLFRPDNSLVDAKYPAVLCPHGHGGRLQRHPHDKLRQMIADGAERFEASGQYPKIARCAQLARMGCVTFIYDMLGYADSQQIDRQLAHRFAKQRDEFEGTTDWGLFSAQAEMRLQSVIGIQTWNSIRCLDFLEQLPDVDSSRMAVTGGSGGGTQTILLCAIDERPVAAFPNGMVSTAMQGGCTCENGSLLRVGTGNVELAALFAPKPQGMTAADDWTVDMMTDGYPELQQLYSMFGVKDHVMCRKLTHFPHNYNYVSRAT
ncbi:MAG: alpha/beta hydrolase family protein, partial [Pirellulaceae bacterium]|nr:alpha/beta hydrolase family protein [Pirellulaceae bacterium]